MSSQRGDSFVIKGPLTAVSGTSEPTKHSFPHHSTGTGTGSATNEDPLINSIEEETHPPIKHVSGVSEVVDSYSIFLLDMWGVMHGKLSCTFCVHHDGCCNLGLLL